MQSGLYIFRFIPPNCPPEGEKTTDSEKECHIPHSSEELVDWHVLLKITVESEGLSVGSQGKIFVMEDECCANSGSSGEPVVISGLGRVLRPVKGRNVTVVMRCPCRWQYAETLRFDVHFDKLEGHVVGLKDEILHDVTVSYEGSQAYGGYIGEATIAVKGKPFPLSNRLRFVLDPYTGPLCTMCLDPIYAQGYGCSGCGMVEYCSSECQAAHMSGGHGLLCQKLKQTYTQSSEKVVAESEKGTEVVAWWRCLGGASYSILVDYRNELGQAIEFFICTLKPAQNEGLRFRYIVEKGTTPKEVNQEKLAEFACTVFSAVSKNSISKGCASLAAACLNYIFVFSRHIEDIVDSHFLYYSSYLSEDFEGTMSSVEEYVTYARPLHELGVALIEFALKMLGDKGTRQCHPAAAAGDAPPALEALSHYGLAGTEAGGAAAARAGGAVPAGLPPRRAEGPRGGRGARRGGGPAGGDGALLPRHPLLPPRRPPAALRRPQQEPRGGGPQGTRRCAACKGKDYAGRGRRIQEEGRG